MSGNKRSIPSTSQLWRAAKYAQIDVTDEILQALEKCLVRGGGRRDARLRQEITEYLLMYFNVYRHRPHVAKIRRDLKVLRKSIERLQLALPLESEPANRLLFDLQFAWLYYAGNRNWREFRDIAAQFDGAELSKAQSVLDFAQKFVVAAESLVGTSRRRKYPGLEHLVVTLALAWRDRTGRIPTSGRDPVTHKQSGPFADFVRQAMLALPPPFCEHPAGPAIRSVCEHLAREMKANA